MAGKKPTFVVADLDENSSDEELQAFIDALYGNDAAAEGDASTGEPEEASSQAGARPR